MRVVGGIPDPWTGGKLITHSKKLQRERH